MEKSAIRPGAHFALRESTKGSEPFQRVKVLEHVRGRYWRVEWIDPNPGLVDLVTSASIVVPWKERKAFALDERRHSDLACTSGAEFPGTDSPVAGAVDIILEATSEDVWVDRRGVFSYSDPDTLGRLAQRANIEPPEGASNFRDRHGRTHHPFSDALLLARAIAAAEPQTVLTVIDADERRYELEAKEPGSSHLIQLLNRWRAEWALVRQWAGHDAAIAAREAERRRLPSLIDRTVWDLRRPGADPAAIADRLERSYRGRQPPPSASARSNISADYSFGAFTTENTCNSRGSPVRKLRSMETSKCSNSGLNSPTTTTTLHDPLPPIPVS